jgi:RHS repeat-associated protein
MNTRPIIRLAALAAVLATPQFASAVLFNPDPAACACVDITVNGLPNPQLKAAIPPTIIRQENGDYALTELKVLVDSSPYCTNILITKILLRSVAEPGRTHVPTFIDPPVYDDTSGTKSFVAPLPAAPPLPAIPRATIPGNKVRESNSNHWEVIVFLTGLRTGDPVEEVVKCSYPITLGEGCAACECETGEPSVRNESGGASVAFSMDSKAKDAKGTVEFHTPNFTNPGPAGLIASVPSIVTVNRTGGVITSVVGPISTIEISSSATTFDPNAFTVTHKHTATGTTFRTTSIQRIQDGGVTYLRVDSTHLGTARRYQQSQAVTGTFVLESGGLVGVSPDALREVTLVITVPEPGTEVHRETVRERATAAGTYATVSDIQSTWSNYPWGWEMIEQIIDPDGTPLTSTWTYYGPGEITGAYGSEEGFGLLHTHSRYDGHQEIHTYWLNNHNSQLPFADDADGLTIAREFNTTGAGTHTIIRSAGGNTLSKDTETYDSTANTVTATSYTALGTLTTVTTLKPYSADFGGEPASIANADGTLTTCAYTRHTTGGGKDVVTSTGTSSGGAVSLGRQTTTTYNRYGTAIRSFTATIGYSTNITLDHTAVTLVDAFGRALTTAHFGSSTAVDGSVQATIVNAPLWTTATSYSCCGIDSTTDRHGLITSYAHDGLRREVKSTSLGVTTETIHSGLTTDIHRYISTGGAAPGNRISSHSRNRAGDTTSSSAPDPSTSIAGTLVATTTATTYKPLASLSKRIITTVPGGFIQTDDFYLDGSAASTTGDLAPTRIHGYTTNGTGLITTIAYASGNEAVAANTDWAGRTVYTTQNGKTTTSLYFSSTDPAGSRGRLKSVADADAVRTLFDYNALGEQTVTALDMDGDSIIDYDGTDRITVTTTEPGTYTVSSIAYPVMTTTSKVYTTNSTTATAEVSKSHRTPDGLRSWSIAPGVTSPASTLVSSTTWAATATNPDGTHSVTSINAKGLTDSVKQYSADIPPVLITQVDYTYDSLNRPETSVDSRTGTTTTFYMSNTADAVLKVRDPGSRDTTFGYDSRGHRLTTTLPDTTSVTHTSYYPHGGVRATWGSQTYSTYTTYDYALRRAALHTWQSAPTITQETDTPPDDSFVTTWTYSTANGTLTSKLDDAGNGPTYTYTNAGRLETRTLESETVTTYGYTKDQLTSTSYSDNTPDLVFTFKRFGSPHTVTQNFQSKIEYTYDSDLLLDTEIVSYDGNKDGDFLDAGIDLVRTLDRSDDSFGRNTGWTLSSGAGQHRADYTYDTAGRLSTVGDTTTGTFTYGYNYSQTLASDPRVGAVGGAKQDFMTYTVTGPAHIVTNTYEGRRDAIDFKVNQNRAGAPATVSSYDYSVDIIGKREDVTHAGTAMRVPGTTIGWYYNASGELTKEDFADNATADDRDRVFQYDAIGNREIAKAGTLTLGTTKNYVATPVNEYSTANGIDLPLYADDPPVLPAYSADGNYQHGPLPVDQIQDHDATLVWDGENRLVSVTKFDGGVATYDYDYLSRRIRKTVTPSGGPAVTTRFVYDGWNLIAEYTGTELKRTYTWGMDLSGSMQGAGGVGGLLAVSTRAPTTGAITASYYPTYDGNGNVSEYLQVTTEDDPGEEGNQRVVAVVAHYEYDAFGNTVATLVDEEELDINLDFAHRFSTKYLDAETGLYYYGYRYYDPLTGRWPSRDPIGEQGGMNLYGFVDNQPISRHDKLGLICTKANNLLWIAEWATGVNGWNSNPEFNLLIVGWDCFDKSGNIRASLDLSWRTSAIPKLREFCDKTPVEDERDWSYLGARKTPAGSHIGWISGYWAYAYGDITAQEDKNIITSKYKDKETGKCPCKFSAKYFLQATDTSNFDKGKKIPFLWWEVSDEHFRGKGFDFTIMSEKDHRVWEGVLDEQ